MFEFFSFFQAVLFDFSPSTSVTLGTEIHRVTLSILKAWGWKKVNLSNIFSII